jgi:hypothetical protein
MSGRSYIWGLGIKSYEQNKFGIYSLITLYIGIHSYSSKIWKNHQLWINLVPHSHFSASFLRKLNQRDHNSISITQFQREGWENFFGRSGERHSLRYFPQFWLGGSRKIYKIVQPYLMAFRPPSKHM